MAAEAEDRARGEVDGLQAPGGEAQELHPVGGARPFLSGRTPLFEAQNSDRYQRQKLVEHYQELTGANLITFIDQIYPDGIVMLEDLLYDCSSERELHVLLSSPGGDGETALRMIRVMQSHCSRLTFIVPDMAKSAATILCLGADRILMGPAGDLGPIDPQMRFPTGAMASAKEIVAAIDEAERRVNDNPNSFPLFSSLLSDVNMFMVEQARSALSRSESLMKEALASLPSRTAQETEELAARLKAPLIEDPSSHSAVVSADDALRLGLPVERADVASEEWRTVWALWTHYFALGAFPAGRASVYEGQRASNVQRPSA